ncbi:MAG: hypothetical protein ACKESB_01950 [Candidatus Hodgkinia cicadicola]
MRCFRCELLAPLVRPFAAKRANSGRLAAAGGGGWVHISIGSRDVSFESFWEFNLSAISRPKLTSAV